MSEDLKKKRNIKIVLSVVTFILLTNNLNLLTPTLLVFQYIYI
jgi:hypothetical protein